MMVKKVVPVVLIAVIILILVVVITTRNTSNPNIGNTNTGTNTQKAKTETEISVKGRQILVNGEPFQIKGVCWNPVGIGKEHPKDLDYIGFAEKDSLLMKEAGINTVRTYEPITDAKVLDKLYENGIYVINTVYSYGGNDPESAGEIVNQIKDHPAILMWCVGNEWNYNGIYAGLSTKKAEEKINLAAASIKKADPTRPVTTVYGNIPTQKVMSALTNIDVWGLNIYSGLNFGALFEMWPEISEKPLFLAEYGADSWNARLPGEDQEAQAKAAKELTSLILENSSAKNPDKVCLGGTIFAWADEWWKDGKGSLDQQDVGGIAPGGGPYPDSVFNEEYWGIVDINRNPKAAYSALQEIYTGTEQ